MAFRLASPRGHDLRVNRTRQVASDSRGTIPTLPPFTRDGACAPPPLKEPNPMPEQQALDAIALLKQDHGEVEELFARYEKARPGTKQKLAQQICDELKIHS